MTKGDAQRYLNQQVILVVYCDSLCMIETEGVVPMPQMKPIDGGTSSSDTAPKNFGDEEDRQDYLDACAAADAIEEALETGEITPFEDFAKEMGY
jgi:hypothetical protein